MRERVIRANEEERRGAEGMRERVIRANEEERRGEERKG
jgi:hypothetical protein